MRAGAGRDHLGLRHAPPSDPRLCADARGHRFRRRLRLADLRGQPTAWSHSPAATAARQLRQAQPRRRARHRLWPYEPDRGAPGAARPARAGDRLCRLDRPVDRAAPALRSLSQRPHGEPDCRSRFVTRAQLDGQRTRRLPRTLAQLQASRAGRRAGARSRPSRADGSAGARDRPARTQPKVG